MPERKGTLRAFSRIGRCAGSAMRKKLKRRSSGGLGAATKEPIAEVATPPERVRSAKAEARVGRGSEQLLYCDNGSEQHGQSTALRSGAIQGRAGRRDVGDLGTRSEFGKTLPLVEVPLPTFV